jgi:hypothetical protein
MSSIFRKIKFSIAKKWKNNDEDKQNKHSKIHQISSSIFRITLRNPESELILMPINDKRIIKLESHGLYIKLERYSLSITNHKYNYIVNISVDVYNKLSLMFDHKIDNINSNEERQILNQLEIGITNVLESIKNKNNG